MECMEFMMKQLCSHLKGIINVQSRAIEVPSSGNSPMPDQKNNSPMASKLNTEPPSSSMPNTQARELVINRLMQEACKHTLKRCWKLSWHQKDKMRK
ncbi:hypothetical protein AXF42_Ash020834 [Apostasia shenzhenica]|uniref:Uncharacterized protein n=1 Tax=Apostasia shenzhenica TaxID=1088818 RepID=A0A2I0A3E2_9ASPA|nr:hypothetical protein AXF42_Ash020834 [Apostasia shenzhenica]